VDLQIMEIYKSRICFKLLSCRGRRWFSRATVKLVLRKAPTSRHSISVALQSGYLRTVKFSTVLVNLLCFDFNFAFCGFTNQALVLNCCHVVPCSPKQRQHKRNIGYE